jgi:predicted nucleic acid-binding Zn ribbon protein
VVLGELSGETTLAGGMRLGRLARQWPSVVGARLGEECVPVALRQQTLVVRATSSAWAAQLSFLSEEIRTRSNEALGGPFVRSVRVVLGDA